MKLLSRLRRRIHSCAGILPATMIVCCRRVDVLWCYGAVRRQHINLNRALSISTSLNKYLSKRPVCKGERWKEFKNAFQLVGKPNWANNFSNKYKSILFTIFQNEQTQRTYQRLYRLGPKGYSLLRRTAGLSKTAGSQSHHTSEQSGASKGGGTTTGAARRREWVGFVGGRVLFAAAGGWFSYRRLQPPMGRAGLSATKVAGTVKKSPQKE